MKKSKGFTLVELIIVIVIVGILSIVAVPIYRGYTKKAIATEAKALLGSISTSEKVYFAEFGNYYDVTLSTNYNNVLDIDSRTNKYFMLYSVTADHAAAGKSFTALVAGSTVTAASGISLSMTVDESGLVVTTATGLD